MTWLKKYWKWIALVLGLILLSVAISFLPVAHWLESLTEELRRLGLAGALLYVAVYAIAAVLLFPGAIFTIAAGLIYGVVYGTAVAISGASLGAGFAFLVARYLLRRRIEESARQNARFHAIDRAIGREGWKIVGLLRLSPLIPFNLSNYLYGVTSIGFWPYFFASAIGMFPGTLLFAYFGAIGTRRALGRERRSRPAGMAFPRSRPARDDQRDRLHQPPGERGFGEKWRHQNQVGGFVRRTTAKLRRRALSTALVARANNATARTIESQAARGFPEDAKAR